MKLRTIIISDLHLWTPDAQPQKLLKFLENHPCETLILNWDIIDQLYLKYFWKRNADQEKILTTIEKICKKNQTKIFYLSGNHESNENKISSILGDPKQEILIISNKKKYLVCHGDSFEKTRKNPNIITLILFFTDTFFGRLDRNLGTNYKISHFLKTIYEFFTSKKTRFIQKAIAYAKKKKVDGIICGHIHQAEIRTIENIDYLNSWDWTETCSALVEDSKGNWKIIS